jgi:hypothetical protein
MSVDVSEVYDFSYLLQLGFKRHNALFQICYLSICPVSDSLCVGFGSALYMIQLPLEVLLGMIMLRF